jgi:cobalt-zinc-cadmium efflux system outer membrane protein
MARIGETRSSAYPASRRLASVVLPFVCLALPSLVRAGQEDDAKTPVLAHEVVDEVRERNPQLSGLDARVEAAEHVVPRVGSLPDPMFMVGLSNWPLSADETPLTGVQFELQQTFPWFGKLDAKEDVASQDVRIRKALRAEQENLLVARAWALLWELRFLVENRKLALEIGATLDHFAKVAEAAYSVGSGRQQDLIKPMVERHRIDDMVLGIDRKMDMVRSEINALRARPPEAPIQPPDMKEAEDEMSTLVRKRLREFSYRTNPLMKLREAAIEKQRAALRLAEKDYYPDFTVGLQYRLRWVEQMDAVGGADFVGVTLGMNLPVYFGSKQSKREAEVRSIISAERDQRDATWDLIRDRIERVAQGIDRDVAQAELYRKKIIPDTEQALNSSLADYQSGRIEFLSVLDNLMKLFRARVDLVRRTTRIQASLAELDHLLGGSAEAALGKEAQP